MKTFEHPEVDLFAGVGGWNPHDTETAGIENNPVAVATRDAAGLATIQEDVRRIGPVNFPNARRLKGSPPCQTFAQSGNGNGMKALQHVRAAADQLVRREPVSTTLIDDVRTTLILEPLRWAIAAIDLGRPFEFLAFEQVPTVLPVWQHFADLLATEGYITHAMKVGAEQFGAPQARQRAILVAHQRSSSWSLQPTHSRYHRQTPSRLDPDVQRWVTMADGLGWVAGDGHPEWVHRRPSTTVVASFRPDIIAGPGYRKAGDPSRQNAPGSVQVTLEQAARLQTFPDQFPWQGSDADRFRQVGNAIPPAMAAGIERGLTVR